MMKSQKEVEALFLDAVEGRMSEAERRDFDEALQLDPELQRSFMRYQTICEVERNLAASDHEAPVGFSTRIMARVEEEPFGFIRRLYMRLEITPRQVMRGLAACAVVVLCLAVVWNEDGSMTHRPILPSAENRKGASPGVVVPEPVKKIDAVIPKNAASKEKDKGTADAKAPLEGIAKGTVGDGQSVSGSAAVVVPQNIAKQRGGETLLPESTTARPDQQVVSEKERTAEIFKKIIEPASTNESREVKSTAQQPASQALTISDLLANPLERTKQSDGVLPGKSAAAGSSQYLRQGASDARHELGGMLQEQLMPTLPIPYGRESYQNYGERQVISTEVEPVSTFSIDVDTGSYTNVRRMLRSGQLPPADAVRIEEFLNYFSYQYPLQTEKPFTLSYEVAPAPLEEGKLLLKLGIRARDMVEQRKPWNLVFLIDVSGSMNAQNRLPLVKSALKILVDQMKSGDRVGIVTYAGYSGVALEPTDISQKSRIIDIIDRLGAGGSTAGAAGIQQAYDLARRNFSSGAVNRVILATDGDFNVGISDRSALIRMIETQRQSGVTLTTVGVGEGNLQEATMEQLANKGNGNFFYLDSFEEARKVFQKDVAGTVEVVAKDVKLQMEFNPLQVSHYRLIGYENRALANHEFHDDRIDAGEIGTGHTVTALYEVVLRQSPLAKQLASDRRYGQEATSKIVSDPHQGELGFLRIRFKEPEAQSSSLLEFPIERSSVNARWQDASDDFRFATAVSYFGHILRQSQFRGAYGFDQVKALATAAYGKDSEGQRREFVQLVELAKAAQGLGGEHRDIAPGLVSPEPTSWPAAPGLQ